MGAGGGFMLGVTFTFLNARFCITVLDSYRIQVILLTRPFGGGGGVPLTASVQQSRLITPGERE